MNLPESSKPLLGPVATQFATESTGTWRTQRPEVDNALCVRCGICAEYCPTGVIQIPAPTESPLEINWFNCKGCGICVTLCPRECIRMIPEGANHA